MTTRGDRTRATLIRTTNTLVARLGYHRTTTRAIAEAAGVSEGTIYRHFPDKRALFFAAVLDGHEELLRWMAELPAQAGADTLRRTLTQCLLRLSELREAVLPLELALAADPQLTGPPNPGDLPAALSALGGPPHQLALYLAAEQQLGRIRPDVDTTKSAVILLAALFALAVTPVSPDDVSVADVVDIFLTGIAA